MDAGASSGPGHVAPATAASRSSTTSTSRSTPGEVVCLLGPNGAGKTTTLLALAGELPLIAGEVAVRRRASRRRRSQARPQRHVLRHRGALGVQGHDAARQPARRPASTPTRRVELFPELEQADERPRRPALRRRAADAHAGPRARPASPGCCSPTSSRSASRRWSSTACCRRCAAPPTSSGTAVLHRRAARPQGAQATPTTRS